MYSQKQLPYAPSPYSYTPNQALASNINLDEEVKLWSTSAERDLWESLAEIYSIIVTLDLLEKAYVRDSISQAEYTPTCLRLLGQYKSILQNRNVAEAFGDLESFKQQYDMDCPHATKRIDIGIPEAFDVPAQSSTSNNSAPARAIAEATQAFITFLDALRLSYKAKDTLHPLLSDVITSVNAVTMQDFQGRSKIVEWLIKLNAMKATEEISDEQLRELSFDIEQSYEGFKGTLR